MAGCAQLSTDEPRQSISVQRQEHLWASLAKHAQVELLLFPIVAAELFLCQLQVPPDIGIFGLPTDGS